MNVQRSFIQWLPVMIFVFMAMMLWVGVRETKFLKKVVRNSLSNQITLYSAALMRKPLDEMTSAFEQEYGVQIKKIFGASGAMIAQMELSGQGDVFISADEEFMRQAISKDLVDVSRPLAQARMVIAVGKGNPKKVKGLDDLLRNDVRVGMGEVRSTAVGRMAQEKLGARFIQFYSNAKVQAAEVGDLATALELGHLDAVLIWKPIALQRSEKMEWMDFEGNEKWISHVCGAVVKRSQKRDSAEKLIQGLESAAAKQILLKYGYELINSAERK